MAAQRRLIILGAAGRDFHDFNVVFRSDPGVRVVAFTAAQIPDISGRRYPPELAGPAYPDGIPIVAEAELPELLRQEDVDEVVFAYSDVTHEHVMHLASLCIAKGVHFRLLGGRPTMLTSSRPVIAVTAVRTGSGKSQTTRFLTSLLKRRGLRVAVVRHPMPYGDLARQAVQRFLAEFAAGDVAAAALHTDNQPAAEPSMRAVWRGLQASALTATAGRTRINADTANVDVTYTWKLPRGREWSYEASVVAGRTDGGWGVRWTSTDIHPDLGANQKLVFQVTEAPRGTINEADGSTVMTNGTMVGISFDAKAATDAGGNVVDSVTRLLTAVGPFNPRLSAQAVIEQSTASDTPYPIVRLNNSEFDRLRGHVAVGGR